MGYPDEPDVGKILEPAQRLGPVEGRQQFQTPLRFLRQKTLAGNTELLPEGRPDHANRAELEDGIRLGKSIHGGGVHFLSIQSVFRLGDNTNLP